MAANKQFGLDFVIGSKLASSFGSGFAKARSTIEGMNKSLKNNKQALQDTAKAMAAVGTAALGGLAFTAKAAMDAESAMAEFKKVFNGTTEEAQQFQKDFMKIAEQTGKSFKDIATIGAAAAQSGIESKDIVKFTNDAVKMGIAFDTTAEQAGQSMAELRTAFRLNQDEVVELADKINFLGNTTPAAAKGIMEIVQRIGPLGEVGGFASGSIAALGATMRGMGIQEEIAATGIKNMMLSLIAGESATKSQRTAYNKLGLDSAKVAKSMQKDAEKTTLTVLEAVKKLPKDQQGAMLASLFGKESLSAIAPMLTNMEALEKNLKSVSEANKNAWQGSMIKEYEARAATTEFAINRAKAALMNIAIVIGTTLLPYITKAAEWVSKVATSFQEWAKNNPELVEKLTKIAVVVAAVVAVLGTLAVGIWALSGPFTIMIGLIKGVGMAFAFVSRLFLMNPIGLAVTAIIAVIYLLWSNWDTVSKFMGQAWDYIKQKGVELMDWFKGLPARFIEFGRNLLQGLADGIKNGTAAALAAAGDAVESVKNKVKNFFGINSPSRMFMEFGEWNMKGLANGMTAGAPIAERQANNAVSGIAPVITKQQASNGINNNTSVGGTTIQLTQNITVGSQDAYEQAKQGASDGVKNFASEYAKMQQQKSRLEF